MPPPSLSKLIAPGRCALVTQECQGGVIGPNAGMPQLGKEARREAIPNIGRLLEAARRADVNVVHCLMNRRPDGRGSNSNTRLAAFGNKSGFDFTAGSEGGSLLAEFGPEDSDIVLTRYHGIGPMGGTDLDAVLRNLGVATIVGVGVSINIAMQSFVMDAVNLAYQFVLPRDAVAGFPRAYAETVIDNTLSLLATVVTTDEIVTTWENS